MSGYLRRCVAGCLLLALWGVLAACAPSSPVAPGQPAASFPTMTPGSRIDGTLPTPRPASANLLANPATAIAAASRPTATPDYAQCPPPDDSTPFSVPTSAEALPDAIADFLSDGGTNTTLERALRDAGFITDDAGLIRANYDLTGESTSEVIVSYATPENGGGVFLVFTCADSRYALRYQNAIGDTAPQVLNISDLNRDAQTDLLFAAEECSDVDGLCEYRTVIITWEASSGRFVNLLNTPPDGDTPPSVADLDNDEVLEVITVQEDAGNPDSGPIRTGSQIYDWNGETYVLSVSRPDPVRFTIQAVHEADNAFQEERMDDAARLYLYMYEEGEDELGNWYGGGEVDVLRSYVLYRILLTFTYSGNGDPLTAYERVRSEFPNLEDAPIYARMADQFWNTYQETNNLNAACTQVLNYIRNRPSAVDLLNRYGTRSPTYTAERLCPF